MPSDNRKRITIERGASSLLYPPVKLDGWEHVGLVTVGSETSQLVRNQQTGLYARYICGAIRNLDQRKVILALGINQEQREEFERFGY